MRRKWTVGHLATLAELCPESGEDHVKQLFQWEHDVSKAWALALLGAAFAFIGSAALSLLEADVETSSVTTWAFVTAGAAAIVFSAFTLRSLRDLPPEYLHTLHMFSRLRRQAGL